MGTGLRLVDHIHPVNVFPAAVPSTSVSAYVNLANYNHVTFVIQVTNATTVTGSAVTLTQALDTSGTTPKALAFTTVYQDIDTATLDALAATAVTSNTFTTLTTNSKKALYIIEVDAAELDQANGYVALAVSMATGVAATLSVVAYLSGARFGGGVVNFPSAL